MDEDLLVEERGAVLWLTLNRPAAMNALTPAMIGALDRAITQAESNEHIRCVVITAVGRAFCAGADLKAVRSELGSDEQGLSGFLARATALQLELAACDAHVWSHDFKEGLAAFQERRAPFFLGR